MPDRSYGQFCPLAITSELLCTRWTMVLVRELMAGSTRFNELRRGLPRISSALLAQRLKELEEGGVVAKVPIDREPGVHEYKLTSCGEELAPVIMAFGKWGQRWVPADVALRHLDPGFLMWGIRRSVNFDPPPTKRRVIQFSFADAPVPTDRRWWLVVEPDKPVDLCKIDPGFDVDLFVSTPLRTMTSTWMGHETFKAAIDDGRMVLTGDPKLAATMSEWLVPSPFSIDVQAAA